MGNTVQTLIGRTGDLDYIHQAVSQGACCSIVGTSNLGKSALLRHLGELPPSSAGAFVYIDCNQMAEHTARSFFAVIWRALAARLEKSKPDAALSVKRWTSQIIHLPSSLAAQSAFEDALAFALASLPHPLVLCLDEFDQVYVRCEPQTFLNLRSLRDRYGADLLYVTATERELARMTTTREQGEFYELVSAHIHFLSFWDTSDSQRFCQELAQRDHITVDESNLRLIYDQAGGHPGLTQVVCQVLGSETGASTRDPLQNRAVHPLVLPRLASDGNVRSECDKIWDDLAEDERQLLLNLPRVDMDSAAGRSLQNKCILRDTGEGPAF
ncbi:MAG: ATP-binding protein, partial [Anaerolineae bacterium]